MHTLASLEVDGLAERPPGKVYGMDKQDSEWYAEQLSRTWNGTEDGQAGLRVDGLAEWLARVVRGIAK